MGRRSGKVARDAAVKALAAGCSVAQAARESGLSLRTVYRMRDSAAVLDARGIAAPSPCAPPPTDPPPALVALPHDPGGIARAGLGVLHMIAQDPTAPTRERVGAAKRILDYAEKQLDSMPISASAEEPLEATDPRALAARAQRAGI